MSAVDDAAKGLEGAIRTSMHAEMSGTDEERKVYGDAVEGYKSDLRDAARREVLQELNVMAKDWDTSERVEVNGKLYWAVPFFVATNALLQGLAFDAGKSISEMADELRVERGEPTEIDIIRERALGKTPRPKWPDPTQPEPG
jgi:hypothetical protein